MYSRGGCNFIRKYPLPCHLLETRCGYSFLIATTAPLGVLFLTEITHGYLKMSLLWAKHAQIRSTLCESLGWANQQLKMKPFWGWVSPLINPYFVTKWASLFHLLLSEPWDCLHLIVIQAKDSLVLWTRITLKLLECIHLISPLFKFKKSRMDTSLILVFSLIENIWEVQNWAFVIKKRWNCFHNLSKNPNRST